MQPPAGLLRRELNYLRSARFSLGSVEQFAQTWTPQNKGPTRNIFSAPLPAKQQRVMAFAPFIESKNLGRLEFVVAPPTEEVPLQYEGEFGGIHEYAFVWRGGTASPDRLGWFAKLPPLIALRSDNAGYPTRPVLNPRVQHRDSCLIKARTDDGRL